MSKVYGTTPSWSPPSSYPGVRVFITGLIALLMNVESEVGRRAVPTVFFEVTRFSHPSGSPDEVYSTSEVPRESTHPRFYRHPRGQLVLLWVPECQSPLYSATPAWPISSDSGSRQNQDGRDVSLPRTASFTDAYNKVFRI